ncbi:glycosyltransferase family 2 protein [Clostridium sp.]|uniref:glycosyltransferase family 2 protein n=1 Tax=Clostridium TaxID=1485 RepID=UPI00257F1517|nr:glycosyltransferase family 2 protein [Clostridium sp.]MBE6056122.1 glycosyltransferase family 2 protein [Clostridium sp.]HDK7167355.1 glycosyltransferase family 2 protein [Clostridium botulinum]
MPLLSIVIPVYNVQNYLEQCLNSILDQDFKDYEVILVDNASTDKSGGICDNYALEYENIKVVHLYKNCLPAGARNIGLKNAMGKYVHFCDSDDYYTKNSFSYISNTINETFPDVIVGKFICKPEKGAFHFNDVNYNIRIFKEMNTDAIVGHLLNFSDSICTVWRFIANRKFLIKNKITFLEGYNCEDEEWVPKLICTANTFSLIEEPFYCYRPRKSGSITSTKTYMNSSRSQLATAISLLKFLKEKNCIGIRKKYIMSRVKFLIGLFATRCDTFIRSEMIELAKIIEDNMEYFNCLKEISKTGEFFDFVNRYGSCIGLSLYRTYIIEKTVEKVYGNEDKKIYIFPTGYNGEGTARILKNEGYKVEGFLDNSNTKNGCIIDGLEVNLPSILKNIDDEKLSNIFIVISTQKRQVVEILRNQLKSLNIKENQFAIRIY